jgi:hypothetical protein
MSIFQAWFPARTAPLRDNGRGPQEQAPDGAGGEQKQRGAVADKFHVLGLLTPAIIARLADAPR